MIAEFLFKAQENLAVAQNALEQKHFNAATNRAYYAAFQAAIAALAEEGIKHPKNPHSWVQAQFSGVLVTRRKRYPSKLTSYLLSMQSLRDKADYEAEYIGKASATMQVRQSLEFVSTISERLKNNETQG
jgi:uncharacterized protein (UPF0332 family)